MAYPTIAYHHQGGNSARPIAESSTVQYHPLGTRAVAKDDTYGVGEFIYLLGVASTAAGDFVCYNMKTGVTVRAVHGGATSTGPGAVAMSDNVAGQYGWYAVFGAVPVVAATVAADAPLYLTSTAGTLDDAAVEGDKISGIISRAATSSGYATCQLAYPEVSAESAGSGIISVTLAAAAENTGANTIEVEGQVSTLAGVATGAVEVLVRSLAVTANEGDLSIGAGSNPGTLIKAVNPATGENVAWITTTAAGHFRFIVTNTAGESNLVHVTAPGGVTQLLKLTFV